MTFSSSKSFLRLFITLLAVVQLSSCALFQKNMLSNGGDWAFNGKIAIRNANEASSFNVKWLQQGDFYQIELTGPLGQGRTTIKGQPGEVTLTSGKDTYHATNLNQLVYKLTELELPLDHLSYWVRAMALPGVNATISKSDSGLVDSITQSGWKVSYYDYFSEVPTLPRKLTFARNQDSGKLVIREWFTQSE